METKDAEFLKKLLALFKIEAEEHLQVISFGLSELARGDSADPAETLETVFREAHSLKGAARSVNLADTVSVCQALENVFSALKHGRITFTAPVDDLLNQTVDFCNRLIDGGPLSTMDKAAVKQLIRQLNESVPAEEDDEEEYVEEMAKDGGKNEEPATDSSPIDSPVDSTVDNATDKHAGELADLQPPPPAGPPIEPSAEFPGHPGVAVVPPAAETVRIATTKLDTLLLQTEEMISIKLATGQRAAELRELKKVFDAWKKMSRKESGSQLPGNARRAEPLRADPFIASFETRLNSLARAAEYDHRSSATMIDMLLDDMKKALMLPFSSMLTIFPRLARDLGRAAGKKVELITEGGEIEIDRRVLEEMKDPLIHLLRNCLDHGIESPEVREKKKKSPYGQLKIGISSQDSKIEIVVADDGAGIDVSTIITSAVKHATISQEAANKLSPQEALQLIFSSGVTTSPLITDISGRGLGLAIVREKVEKLNGTVTVETRMDQGTTFRLVVPLTLATFRGTLVKVSGQLFVLPSVSVERVVRARKESIETVENRETLIFDGLPVSLVRLGEVLEMKAASAGQGSDDIPIQVAILGAADKRMAFMVDEVLWEQEVLVKPLGKQLSRVRNIAGATVLGSGMVVPILNVPDLLKSAVKKSPSFTPRPGEEPRESRTVLVVEDSITARTLLKNILESAGYDVQTAVDGVDGLTTLKNRSFDIVVSDVEMPRMNGFDLTARIRADKKYAELPVVLVTALESREDRERGIDVGANAYIVKSSFDQSNLLEVIGRLT